MKTVLIIIIILHKLHNCVNLHLLCSKCSGGTEALIDKVILIRVIARDRLQLWLINKCLIVCKL